MAAFFEDLRAALPPTMVLPEPIVLMLTWIEDHGRVRDDGDRRTGYLSGDPQRGTDIAFGAPDGLNWVAEGSNRPADEVASRFCEFAQTGADGSIAAFWLDDAGHQVIVHVGSGSGSDMMCVLAHDAVDFVRLLAIGYEEICWQENFLEPPQPDSDGDFVPPDIEFQDWVRTTFGVTIPERGADLVPAPALLDEEDTDDPFWHWAFDLAD